MVSRQRAGVPVQAPCSTSTRSPPASPLSLLPPTAGEVGAQGSKGLHARPGGALSQLHGFAQL